VFWLKRSNSAQGFRCRLLRRALALRQTAAREQQDGPASPSRAFFAPADVPCQWPLAVVFLLVRIDGGEMASGVALPRC
jgi:hypothetical protein